MVYVVIFTNPPEGENLSKNTPNKKVKTCPRVKQTKDAAGLDFAKMINSCLLR